MSCSKCYEKFTLFKKELGCSKCGFSICSKCSNKQNKNVFCIDCYKQLNNGKINNNVNNRDVSPPENFMKLRKQNENKIIKKNDSDDEIANRLAKLSETKNKDSHVVNDDELHKRLNNLMQINPNTSKLSNLPTKSVVNTADDLIKQYSEEVCLDKKMNDYNKNEIDELEKRVKKLLEPIPGQASSTSSTIIIDTSEKLKNDESKKKSKKTKDLVKKFLAEAEANYISDDDSNNEMDKWCCICNDDGDFKCIDCDNDVYCKRCYKECHDSYEYKTHRKKSI